MTNNVNPFFRCPKMESKMTMADLMALSNAEFKKTCARYDIKVIGGVTKKVKEIKGKKLLEKMGESNKENLAPEMTQVEAKQPTVLGPKKTNTDVQINASAAPSFDDAAASSGARGGKRPAAFSCS